MGGGGLGGGGVRLMESCGVHWALCSSQVHMMGAGAGGLQVPLEQNMGRKHGQVEETAPAAIHDFALQS